MKFGPCALQRGGIDVHVVLCGSEIDVSHCIGQDRKQCVEILLLLFAPEPKTAAGIVMAQVVESWWRRSVDAALCAQTGKGTLGLPVFQSPIPLADQQGIMRTAFGMGASKRYP